MRRVFWVVAIQRIGVGEDGGGLFKRDAMLLEVRDGLLDVPRKDIHVYTLIHPPAARTEGANGLSGLSSLESDAPGFRGRWFHELADGVKECPDVSIMACHGTFQF